MERFKSWIAGGYHYSHGRLCGHHAGSLLVWIAFSLRVTVVSLTVTDHIGLGHDAGPLLQSRLALSTSIADGLLGLHPGTSPQTKSGLCLVKADGIERCRHDVRHGLLLVPSRILPRS